jgi:hypothetical protein
VDFGAARNAMTYDAKICDAKICDAMGLPSKIDEKSRVYSPGRLRKQAAAKLRQSTPIATRGRAGHCPAGFGCF